MDYEPFKWLKKKYESIDKKYVYIFDATFFIGFFTHFFFFSNKFVNHDVLLNTFIDGYEDYITAISVGRWSYVFFNWITSGFSMPQVKGLAALVYMAVSAVLIVKILKIKNVLLGTLVGGIFATFPSVACSFSYSFSMDTYALSFLMAILSVYLIEKTSKVNFLISITALVFSMGIYQSSITFSIALIFILLLSDVLTNQIILKNFIRKVLRYLVFLILGLGIYLIISKGAMFVMGIEANTYRSMDSMAEISLSGMLKGVIYSYAYFGAYFFTTYYLYAPYRVAFNVLAGVIAVLLIIPFYKKWISEKKIHNIWISSLLIILTPVGLNSIPVLMGNTVETGVHRIMLFSLVFLYFLYMKLIDINISTKERRSLCKKAVVQWLGLFPLLMAIHTGFLICNQAYDRMNARYENIYAYLNRVAARMEEIPEWNHDIPVYFANPAAIFNDNYSVEIEAYDKLKRMMGTDLYPWYSAEQIATFMEIYLHFNVEEVDEEYGKEIYESGEFKKMPVFPAKDSIKVINGVMVVKLDK